MLKNPLLQKAFDHVLSQVDDKDAFQKLYSSGVQVIYDKQMFAKLTQGLPQSKDPIGDTAKGVIAVMNIIVHRARGTAPAAVVTQAGFALLLDALDFEEEAGLIKVDNAALDKATMAYADAVAPTVSLSPNRVGGMLEQLKTVANDPQKMAAFQRAVQQS